MNVVRLVGKARHPGRVIRNELDKLGLSANALAQALGVPGNRITEIVRGQRGITADTALRLARFFATEPEYWMTLQQTFELKTTKADRGAEIAMTITPHNQLAVKENAK